MPPVVFTEDAEDAMRHYRWPGNVRQLKNVVEQTALFEAGTDVNADTLRRYIPEISTSYIPATTASLHSYESEREMLLGMIFKLRERIDELQMRIDGDRPPVSHKIIADEDNASMPTSLVVRSHGTPETHVPPCSDVNYSEVEPETPATLEETEREMIRRALERNQGRRKAAAAELQISERTLYRKIKDYGLE